MKPTIAIGLLILFSACTKQVISAPVMASLPSTSAMTISPPITSESEVCVNLHDLKIEQQKAHVSIDTASNINKPELNIKLKHLDTLVVETEKQLIRDGIHCN